VFLRIINSILWTRMAKQVKKRGHNIPLLRWEEALVLCWLRGCPRVASQRPDTSSLNTQCPARGVRDAAWAPDSGQMFESLRKWKKARAQNPPLPSHTTRKQLKTHFVRSRRRENQNRFSPSIDTLAPKKRNAHSFIFVSQRVNFWWYLHKFKAYRRHDLIQINIIIVVYSCLYITNI